MGAVITPAPPVMEIDGWAKAIAATGLAPKLILGQCARCQTSHLACRFTVARANRPATDKAPHRLNLAADLQRQPHQGGVTGGTGGW